MAELDFDEKARRSPPPRLLDFPSKLASGGDERLAADPVTGRNRYGLSRLPTAAEVYFSSSTASCVSPRGLAAACEAWRLLSGRENLAPHLHDWFNDIRRRITDYCGRPDHDCILSASGTDAELLALAIAKAALERPISNIVIAPQETGRGVIIAASGSHFLDTAPFAVGAAARGVRLDGWGDADIRVIGVEIRRDDGEPRPAAEVDKEVWRHARGALADDRGVVVHLLDVSKTGRSGLSTEMADRIFALAPNRVVVLADCCQLRSSPARLKTLLGRGFLLAVTGSKFAGGPPFSGALLVPRRLLDRMDPEALPVGLGAHTSVYDWPLRLASKISPIGAAEPNIGLGLRWIAALSEMERFKTIPPALTLKIQKRFVAAVARGAARIAGLRMLAPSADVAAQFAPTIVPLALPRRRRAAAAAIQQALRASASGEGSGRGFHLGQPVAFGPDVALRVCLGAPMINDVADRFEGCRDFEAAFAPLARDVDDLFDKWAGLWSEFDRGEVE